jgi:hypothetical protein
MMEKDPSSPISFTIGSRWLANCLKNHESCKPAAKIQTPPKRLISVGDKTQYPVLVDIPAASQHVKWVSLSYCWGVEPSMKLTRASMDMLKNGLPLNTFDPTVRDAILVTRALAISYIWIDALCIIQDRGENEWIEEASRMDDIYGGSTVTLVAASSTSTMEGFLKEREVHYVPIPWPTNLSLGSPDSNPSAKVFLSLGWDENEDKLNGPWSNHGWTMQEGLLPNRILYYKSSQMIWNCCEEQKFERGVTKSFQAQVVEDLQYMDDLSFGSGWLWKLDLFTQFKRFRDYLPYNIKGSSCTSNPELFRLWYHLLEDYSRRELTCKNDRLVAFSGLARIFGSIIESHEYIAGLWIPDLIRGLTWYTEGARLIPRQSPNSAFPSWSWASIGNQLIKTSQKSSNSFIALSRVRNVQVDLVDQGDPFGVVNGGRITIAGPLKRISRLYNKGWKSAQGSISRFERYLSELIEEESPGDVEDQYVSPPGGHFAAIKMVSNSLTLDLLILEATGDVSNGISVYRRIGVCTLLYIHESDIAPPELRKIKPSLTTRLGPPRGKRKGIKARNDVVEELESESWEQETVIIV